MIDHLDHLVLTTCDDAACIDFYTRVLGMQLETFVGGTPPVQRQAFKFGHQKINLHVRGREFEPKAHLPVPGALDLCFIASVPLEEVMARVAEIDGVIGQWTAQHTVDEVLAALDRASVPAGRIYTVADIAQDPHYLARDMLQTVRMHDGSDLMVPGIVPKLSRTPGGHRRNAPGIGQDSDAVLAGMGLSAAQIQALREQGIVA